MRKKETVSPEYSTFLTLISTQSNCTLPGLHGFTLEDEAKAFGSSFKEAGLGYAHTEFSRPFSVPIGKMNTPLELQERVELVMENFMGHGLVQYKDALGATATHFNIVARALNGPVINVMLVLTDQVGGDFISMMNAIQLLQSGSVIKRYEARTSDFQPRGEQPGIVPNRLNHEKSDYIDDIRVGYLREKTGLSDLIMANYCFETTQHQRE